ncbi:MAG: DUF3276 family protein [Bacteroidales bacterium]|jgi:hypothetical protein
MEEFENKEREEIFSKSVRAGKRTYFFDVKETRSGEQYLTITESKKRFDNEQGRFYFEKHKIFLYKEDFEKFINGLNGVTHFIETGEKPAEDPEETYKSEFSDIDFESLDTNKD